MILRNFSHILLALVSIARFSSAVGVITYVGCYKASTSDLVLGQNIEDYSWQSSSHCQDVCLQALPVSPRYVLGLYMGRQCACLAAVPAPSLKVDDSNCDVNCTGFPPEMCGGSDYFSVLETTMSNGSMPIWSTDGTAPMAITASQVTVTAQQVETMSPSQTTVIQTATILPDKSPKKSMAGAIAGGVVVGVLMVFIIAAALWWFFIVHRRPKFDDEATARLNEKSQTGSLVAATPDPRYDFTKRRLSDGSITEDQEFQPRKLTVTNPDNRYLPTTEAD